MINILYICTPNSIHDLKWMSYFAKQNNHFTVYAIGELQCKVNDADRIVFEDCGINFLNPIHSFSISGIFKTVRTIKYLRNIIRNKKIDVIHVLVPTPFALWVNYLNTPYIITTRGTDVLVTLPELNSKKRKGIKYFIFSKLYEKVFRNAAFITSTSYAQKNSIQKMYKINNSRVIRTGVDVDYIDTINSFPIVEKYLGNKMFVFSPRHLNNPIYNCELQIEALSFIKSDIIKKYIFVFINKYDMNKSYLDKLVARLNDLRESIGLSFIVIDRLSQNYLWQFYKKAALTIMTPISDGTPNTALEAMAAKCPLIIPNLDYDKDLFENSCFKMSEYSSICLAHLIEKALSDYPANYIENGFINVSEYGNRNIEMSKLQVMYENIISIN